MSSKNRIDEIIKALDWIANETEFVFAADTLREAANIIRDTGYRKVNYKAPKGEAGHNFTFCVAGGKRGEDMSKFITKNPCRCFRPILFALNNDPESEQPMIDFLVSQGLEYLGKQNKDRHGFSRENVFSFHGPNDFRLVIYWMRNLCTIQNSPDGWSGAFTESYFDNIRKCSTGYCDHNSIAFCYGDTEIVKLAIPEHKPAQEEQTEKAKGCVYCTLGESINGENDVCTVKI